MLKRFLLTIVLTADMLVIQWQHSLCKASDVKWQQSTPSISVCLRENDTGSTPRKGPFIQHVNRLQAIILVTDNSGARKRQHLKSKICMMG